MIDLNRVALRRLYNPGNTGRVEKGQKTRRDLHITITPVTYLELARIIPLQKGGYASPVIEMAIRFVLYLTGKFSADKIAEEMFHVFLGNRFTIVQRLRQLADTLENFTTEEEPHSVVE